MCSGHVVVLQFLKGENGERVEQILKIVFSNPVAEQCDVVIERQSLCM